MTLSAAQLVFTNVEKKLSAKGRDGFQIWLRTLGALTEAEETEIQTRLGDFEERRDLKDEPSIRFSYFRLPTGKVVCAKTTPLAETDQFRRGGRYYAHAVILNPDEFETLEADPFAVFDQVPFQQSIDDGLKEGDPATGSLPALTLNPQTGNPAPAPISVERLPSLIETAMRCCDGEKALSLGLAAPPSRVLPILRQIFNWLPPSLRSRFSFDTLSTGRSLTQVPFSLVGLPLAGPPKRYLNLVLFDLAKQSVGAPLPTGVESEYGRWLNPRLRSGEAPGRRQSEAAYRLGRCLDTGVVDVAALSLADSDLFTAMACSDPGIPKLDRIVRTRLEADVGPVLAPLIFSHALHRLRTAGLDGLRELAEPYAPGILLPWLVTVFEHRARADLQRKIEVPALKEFHDRVKPTEPEGLALRRRLALILFRWASSWGNIARWVVDPDRVPDDLYSWYLSWTFSTLPVQVQLSAAASSRGVWCGPFLACEDPADDLECQQLVAALAGLHGEAGPSLPPDRWAMLMHHLLGLVAR